MIIGIISLVVGLVFNIIFANKMQQIAYEKGHDERVWAWCFWLPLYGGFIVAALPDKKTASMVEDLMKKDFPQAKKEEKRILISSQKMEEKPIVAKTVVEEKEGQSEKEKAQTDEKMRPITNEDGTVCCPCCGVKQRAGRKLCWNCGQTFEDM